ncbi:hypothetical protein KAU09_03300 [Candidatus Parcubacteria bacterium]|nr:hypothetical protein [Candidatus Parcubacteria bacterium]
MLFKKDLKFASCIAVIVFLTLGLSISFSSLLAAWTAPTANPPAANLFPPVYNEHATPATNALINIPLGVSGNLTVSGGIITGDGSSIINLNASNLTAGIVSNARLDADLQDLADGSLSGSKVGAGINGDNIANGTIDSSEIQDNTLTASDLAANACGNSEMIDSPSFSSITLGGVNKGSWPVGNLQCITLSTSAQTISCPAGYTMTGGGVRGGSNHATLSHPEGNGWRCACTYHYECYVRCCKVQ